MEDKPLVTPLNPKTLVPDESGISAPSSNKAAVFIIFIVVIIAGLIMGFILSHKGVTGGASNTSATTGKNVVNSANIVGSTDTTTFKDTATGTLQAGGIKGEGTHNLIRDGGPSQTVYLVSSVVDLDSYVGKKVQVWGQTLQAKYAGWLMDIGRLKILE
jgi:hypothetical protein